MIRTTKLTTFGMLVALAGASVVPAMAGVQNDKNNARNLALGGAAVAVYGLLTHNTAATVLGAVGAAAAGSQYEHDSQIQSRDNGRYFYRSGGSGGYDRDGYDNNGYNHDGFSRDGFSRDGYNHDGFNRDGFNRDGFSHDGSSRDGQRENGGSQWNGGSHQNYGGQNYGNQDRGENGGSRDEDYGNRNEDYGNRSEERGDH